MIRCGAGISSTLIPKPSSVQFGTIVGWAVPRSQADEAWNDACASWCRCMTWRCTCGLLLIRPLLDLTKQDLYRVRAPGQHFISPLESIPFQSWCCHHCYELGGTQHRQWKLGRLLMNDVNDSPSFYCRVASFKSSNLFHCLIVFSCKKEVLGSNSAWDNNICKQFSAEPQRARKTRLKVPWTKFSRVYLTSCACIKLILMYHASMITIHRFVCISFPYTSI